MKCIKWFPADRGPKTLMIEKQNTFAYYPFHRLDEHTFKHAVKMYSLLFKDCDFPYCDAKLTWPNHKPLSFPSPFNAMA